MEQKYSTAFQTRDLMDTDTDRNNNDAGDTSSCPSESETDNSRVNICLDGSFNIVRTKEKQRTLNDNRVFV